MGSIILILGNGPTKRIAVYGFALQSSQAKKEVIWCCFSADETEDLSADISLLQEVDYHVVDLAQYRTNQKGGQARKKAFLIPWQRTLDKINSGKYDVVIIEGLDAAFDTEMVKTSDIIQLLRNRKVEQFIITGNYLPAGVLAMANKLVEIWERENG